MMLTEVFVAILVLASVLLGYWMGRNSAGRYLSDNPKPPVQRKKDKAPMVQDPYAEALGPDLPGRISTVEE